MLEAVAFDIKDARTFLAFSKTKSALIGRLGSFTSDVESTRIPLYSEYKHVLTYIASPTSLVGQSRYNLAVNRSPVCQYPEPQWNAIMITEALDQPKKDSSFEAIAIRESQPMPLWPIPVLLLLVAIPFACLWFVAYSGIADMRSLESAAVLIGIITAAMTPITIPAMLIYPIIVIVQRIWRHVHREGI